MNRPRGHHSVEGVRVIALGCASRKVTQTTTRDWAAWICLGLGILCGAGALYLAVSAI